MPNANVRPFQSTPTVSHNVNAVAKAVVIAQSLPPFSGSGAPNVKDWLVSFKRVCNANGWTTPKDQLNQAVAALESGSSAARWFEATYAECPPVDFDDFSKAITEAFGPRRQLRSALADMRDRVQSPGESPTTYFHDKHYLIKQWQPDINDEVVVDMIIEGLLDSIKARALLFELKTPKQLLDKLKSYSEGRQQLEASIFAIEKQTPIEESIHAVERRNDGPTCFQCGGKGHIKFECPNKFPINANRSKNLRWRSDVNGQNK